MIRQATLLPEALRDMLARIADQPAPQIGAWLVPWLRDTGWLDDALASQIKQMASDPLHLPPARASRAGMQRHLVLARHPRFSLAVTLLPAATSPVPWDAPVHFSGQVTVTRVLPGAALDATLFVRDPAGLARRAEDISLAPGDMLELDEHRRTCRIRPGPRTVALLRAAIAPLDAPLASSHDPHNGICIAQSHHDEESARTLMLLSLLRTGGRRDATPYFEAATLARHPHQRWAAMREYLALDTAAALPRLRHMARHDADAELRHLAQATLAGIGMPLEEDEVVPCPA